MFRISLRELLVFVALFALAVASLKYANDAWLAIVAGVAVLAFSVAIIVAAVDRGHRQAFAIGFALTFLAYCASVLTGMTTGSGLGNETAVRNIAFDHWEGRLPTTRLLRYVYGAISSSGYYDITTGKLIPDFDPNAAANQGKLGWGGGGFGGGMAMGGGGRASVSYKEVPPREKFMPIGHCWRALVLGYAGGQFAGFVYRRRLRDEQKLPAETS